MSRFKRNVKSGKVNCEAARLWLSTSIFDADLEHLDYRCTCTCSDHQVSGGEEGALYCTWGSSICLHSRQVQNFPWVYCILKEAKHAGGNCNRLVYLIGEEDDFICSHNPWLISSSMLAIDLYGRMAQRGGCPNDYFWTSLVNSRLDPRKKSFLKLGRRIFLSKGCQDSAGIWFVIL